MTTRIILSIAAVLYVALTMVSLQTSISLQSNNNNPAPEAGTYGLVDAPQPQPQPQQQVGKQYKYYTVEELTNNPADGKLSCPDGLIPIYDRHVAVNEEDHDVNPRKIPRAIHATMKSRCLSPDTSAAMQKWKDALPRHSFYFHDDDAVDRLFEMPWEEFPQLKSFMRCVRFKGAMRIDVWRILVIYKYGGLYTDVDMFPTEQFTESSPIAAMDEAFFLGDAFNRPSQWFFGMEPKHPIAYYTMFRIFEKLQLELNEIERPQVVFVTGPNVLKIGYSDCLGWKTNIGRGKDDLFASGTHQCKWGKTVKKLAKDKETNKYITQLDMKEMVESPRDPTIKVTRKQRNEWLNGVKHWVDEKNSKKIEFDGSCMDYLYSLDHGLLNATNSGKK